MKKIIILILILTIILISKETPNLIVKFNYTKTKKEKTDWEYLIESIIYIESNGFDSVIGNKNCVGCLQLTPIYIREVNKLAKTKYKLSDRFSKQKSIEMFNILQNHYNPDKDIKKAIKLHNPNAPKLYSIKILKKLNILKNEK